MRGEIVPKLTKKSTKTPKKKRKSKSKGKRKLLKAVQEGPQPEGDEAKEKVEEAESLEEIPAKKMKVEE